MCSGPTHRSAPTGVAKTFCVLVGLRLFRSCSGRGMPRPYKGTRQVCHLRRERACPFRRTQERSVTWRSGLFILVPFTKTNMRIPGPGPQARCGKGEGSGEGLGDRCRVPRSSPPSGAGGEQRASLKRTQQDDHPTKREHAAAAATPHPSAAPTPSPPRGRQRRCASPSSNPPTAGPSPPGEGNRFITPAKQNTASSAAPRHRVPPAPPDRGDHTKS